MLRIQYICTSFIQEFVYYLKEGECVLIPIKNK